MQKRKASDAQTENCDVGEKKTDSFHQEKKRRVPPRKLSKKKEESVLLKKQHPIKKKIRGS